ncbi:MAG: hypothetical protein L0099_07510, partial [Acidobacteria bacterium]|nr:hypothetical protein [Acidobacteriota bacterium]
LLWQAHGFRVTSSPEYQQPTYAYQRAPYYYSNVSYFENVQLIQPFVPELGRATAGDMARRAALNLIALPVALGEIVSAPAGFWRWPLRKANEWAGSTVLPLGLIDIPLALLGYSVLACLVVGGALLMARREWFIPLYLTASAGMLCLIPWPEQFNRYLAPLMPFLALLLVSALVSIGEACRRRWPGQWGKVGAWCGVLVLTISFFLEGLALLGTYVGGLNSVKYQDVLGNETVHRLFFYDPEWQALDASLEWLRRRAGPADVIATTVPHSAYVRTGLRAVLPPLEANAEEAQRLLDSVPVRYLVLDELRYPRISQRYAEAVVEKRPDLWKQVYVAPRGQARVYERQP